MEKSLLDFAGRLRSGGVRVSPAEVFDACRSLDFIDLQDRWVFKDALRSTLVKRTRDIPLFDDLFELHFTGGQPSEDVSDETGDGPEDRAARLAELIERFQPDLTPATEMLMTGQFGPLNRMLLDRSEDMGLERMESPLQLNFFLRGFRREMDLDRMQRESSLFADQLEERGLDPDEVQAIREHTAGNFDRLEKDIRRILQRELEKNRYLFVRRIMEEDVAERSLGRLSEEDILSMRPAVEQLARRLKERLSLRIKRADTGRLDLKTTLRKNVGYGGPLPDLHFRKKSPKRPQVVALCDVSRSVSNFSRFMLLFLYTLKEVVSRVRSFIFVGDMVEVTELFQRHDLDDAVSMAASGKGLTYAFRTDYGSSLSQFVDESLTAVNSKTTVFILGDARNNYYEAKEEALRTISERAKKLIWLNPEPRPNWRLGDSVMDIYLPYCTTAAECGNLKQLSYVVEENLLP
ncbi:MAG: VWA domain-containing protein [Proteobacteria bacterium]|nr:VWA domain-containing protein [Pseudomonadota bacterium]